MGKKKELFTISDWVRVAPNWQFWNKQQVQIISCTKCDFQRHFKRTHRGAVSAYLSQESLRIALVLHAQEHAPKKKAKK